MLMQFKLYMNPCFFRGKHLGTWKGSKEKGIEGYKRDFISGKEVERLE